MKNKTIAIKNKFKMLIKTILRNITGDKIVKSILEVTVVASLMGVALYIINDVGSIFPNVAFAKYLPETGDKIYKDSLPYAEDKSTALNDLTLGILGYVKIIVGAVGVLMITVIGGKLVMARGEEEDISKGKTALIYIIIAFILISMAEDFAKILSLGDQTLLEGPSAILKRVKLFDNKVEIVITFVKYFIGAIATFMIAVSGMKLITNGDDEEAVSESKRNIIYSIVGLVMITMSDMAINKVLYKVDKDVYSGINGVTPQVDVVQGVKEIVGATNLVIGVIGPVLLIMLTVASIMYLTAGGDEEKMGKAKRMVIAAIIGVIVMYGSFAIVSTIISSKLAGIGALGK